MSNVFSNSSRSLELHSSSRRSHQSDTELCCRASPTVSCSVPMASSKRSSSLPPLFRNSQFWLGNHSPPPPYPQSNRDFSPLQPLVMPRKPALHHHVHETPEVSKTSNSQQQLLPSLQLSANSSRHHSLSHHLNPPSKHFSRLHARRSHVLQSSSNPGSLPQLSNDQFPLLQSDRPPRVGLHRPFPPTHLVPVLNFRANSPLHPGRSQRRQLQPTSPRPRLAQDPQHSLTRAQSLCNQAGLLGPRPLPAHPEESSSSAPSPPVPSSTLRPQSLHPTQPRPSRVKKQKRLLPTSPERSSGSFPHPSSCTCPGLLQNPGVPRASFSHFSPSTSPPSLGPTPSVQCSIHLHSCRSHSPNLRPRRFRQNSKQQGRVFLGHSKRLGQSSDLCSDECSHPSSSVLRVLPQPLPKTETPLSSTLEKIPYPFFSCDFDFGYFTSVSPHQISNTSSPIGVGLPPPKTPLLSRPNKESSPSQKVSSKRTHSRERFLHSYPNRSWQSSSLSPQSKPNIRSHSSHFAKISHTPSASKRSSSKSLNHNSPSGAGPNLHSQLAPSILGAPPSTNPRPLPHQYASFSIPPPVGSPINAYRKPPTISPLSSSSSDKSLHLPPDSSSSDSSYRSASSSATHKPITSKSHPSLSSRIRASNRLGFLLHSSPFFNYSSDSSLSS
nr:putative movement protein [Andean potato latent virus]